MRPFFPLIIAVSLSLAFANFIEGASAPTLLPAEKASQIADLRNVTTRNGEVSGEVVNHSKGTLRDVQLQILYSWRWKDEFHPGKDDPGRAVYHTLDKEIAPGQSTRFTYRPSPPLPSRADGNFEITVSVAGYTEVFR